MQPPDGNEEAGKLARLERALHNLSRRADAFATGEPHSTWDGDPWALYVEGNYDREGRTWVTAKASPADVSWAIEKLQHRFPIAAFTSATVPDFRSLRLTYGMPAVGEPPNNRVLAWRDEKRLSSPYDLPTMGVTVVPRGPSPKEPRWRAWAADQVVMAVNQAEGRTLVLSSSVAQMRAYGNALRDQTRWEVKVQGEEGRGALREWFKRTTQGVLCATRSFFQGLDVQGESCVCVIIDRIPFARPGDPVEDAVQRLLVERAKGGSGYMLRSVPDAAMVLAQGSGRLIRAHTDRGSVVLLDNRLTKTGTGWEMLRAALPPFPLSLRLDDIGRVLVGDDLCGVPVVRARRNTLRF